MHIRLPILIALFLALVFAAQIRGEDDAAAQKEQLDAQAQQYVQMLQPLMWRELEFIRLTCELAPEQRSKIKAAGDKSVQKAAQGFVRQMQVAQARSTHNPPEVIRKEISKALQETLTAEQFAAFSAEAAKRTASRKNAAILTVVAQLDTALFLTKSQRDKISQELESHWQDDWEQWLSLWQYGGQYFPEIPDQRLTPHLDDAQTKVWRGLQKIGLGGWWGGQMQREPADDKWWDGDANEAETKTDSAPEKE